MIKQKADALDRAFYISLTLKGLNAGLEILGGLLLLLISPATINRLVITLTQNEFTEDRHDFLVTHIRSFGHHLTTSSRLFAVAYLLSHGIVKMVLIVALFKQKLWAYPWMIGVLGLFVVYQVYRMTYLFSVGLLLLTIFDVFIIILTWLEYNRHRQTNTTESTD
jgi:uncharacterized membrane protein